MPYIQALPTWLSVNNVNSQSSSYNTDAYTGQPMTGGALNVGDYTDYTNDSAAAVSYTKNGTLYEGRYRYVQVDSGATAANVKTGTVGYLRSGNQVASAVIATAGSGQTAGTYVLNATGGGGSGAIASVVVGSGGTITSVTITAGGSGYTSAPAFTLAAGGTPGTIAAELNSTFNLVTSYDQISVTGVGSVRPVVFLNAITPGNYGFVQELGIATVLGAASFTDTTIGDWIDATTSGLVNSRASSGSPIGTTIGRAIDLPVVSALFKVVLYGPVVQG